MITVGILLSGNGRSIKERYKEPNLLLQQIFLQYGIHLVRVNLGAYNEKTNLFSQYYTLDTSGNIQQIQQSVSPDLLWIRESIGLEYMYDKLKNYIIVPNRRVIELSSDKYLCYLYMKEFMPKTELLSLFFEYPTLQEQFSNTIVLKPLDANGGNGIKFLSQEELLQHKDDYCGLEKALIVQDFENFAGGYKDIIKGNHDLRVVFLGEKFGFSIVRQPQKGSLKSNINAGGSQFSLEEGDIPMEVIEYCKQIKEKMGIYKNSIFSLDFAFSSEKNQRFLLEINYSPGIRFPEKDKKYQINYFEKLVSFFISMVGNH